MKRRITLMAALVAIGTVAAIGPSPATASASGAGTAACRSDDPLVYRYHVPDTGVGTMVRTCSGSTAVNSRGIQLEAGAWSGWFTANGERTRFCAYDIWFFTDARVTRIEMSPTTVAGCP